MSKINIEELREKLLTQDLDLESQKKLLIDFIEKNTEPDVLDAIKTANSAIKIVQSLMSRYETKPIIKSEIRS